MARYKKKSHRHPRGHWCNCPWGSAQLNDPIDDLWDAEKYGSTKVAWHKESAKLEWLRDRPDMQEPHHQKFLDYLEANHPDHDNLFPWLARERKKGRVVHTDNSDQEARAQRGYALPSTLHFTDNDGRRTELDDDHLQTLQEWMKYRKQAKQGVDIMQQHIGDAIHHSDKWDGMGEIVHQVQDPNYEGWTIRRLRNKRDMRKEGDRMNHCVGSNGMPYIPRQANGDSEYYSLRDRNNEPHATLELNSHQGTRHTGLDPNDPEGAEGWHASEYYGPDDAPVPYEHDRLMHEFFHPRGIYPEPSSGHEEEEEFEPWWDSYYQIDGPTTENDWISHANGDYQEENTPEEYDRAHQDAYDNDMEGPDLEIGDPDIKDIWDDFEWNHTKQPVDPHRVKEMFDTMDEHGFGDEWRDYAQDWLDENYKEYLDPYGQDPEIPPQPSQDMSRDPHAPTKRVLQAPGLPGSYFPGRADPHTEHFARNLDFHLNQFTNPDTGEGMSKQHMERMYPGIDPGHEPKYRREEGPPTPLRPSQYQDYGQTQQELDIPHNEPYNRRRWNIDAPRTGLPLEEDWQNSDVYRNRQEKEKRDALPQQPTALKPSEWDEGGTTNLHQLPVPGLEEHAPNPGHVNQYFRGEPQGRAFPKHWYVDHHSYRSGQTELPPHLFPPERYSWMDVQPHPQQMPMWSANPAHIPAGPKWDQRTNQYDFDNPEINPTLPSEGQSWNMTQGEPSPSNYMNPYEKGPQTAIAPGGAHPTVPFQARYHPRDDEEWVDDDEPEFTATQPEPRWHSS